MRLIFALLFVLACSPVLAADTAYFSALPDLPLAPGLTEEADSAVRFDQPEGRIVVLQAVGAAQVSDIMNFYAKTLPALGWTMKAPGQYSRDKEVLQMEVKPAQAAAKGRQTRLQVMLRPQ